MMMMMAVAMMMMAVATLSSTLPVVELVGKVVVSKMAGSRKHKSPFDATIRPKCAGCSQYMSPLCMRGSNSSRCYPPRGKLCHQGIYNLHPKSRCPVRFPLPHWPLVGPKVRQRSEKCRRECTAAGTAG